MANSGLKHYFVLLMYLFIIIILVVPSEIIGSIVKAWPAFITPTALFSGKINKCM